MRDTSRAPLLLLAYGNPLRGDDGVGWVIGERLAAVLAADGAEVIVLHQLMPELAEPISRAERVIFIDAAEGENAGAIQWAELEPGTLSPQPFTHQVEPASLLAAAHDLYGHAPPAHLLTITGADFGYGEELSPVVEKAAGEVANNIRQMIESKYWALDISQ